MRLRVPSALAPPLLLVPLLWGTAAGIAGCGPEGPASAADEHASLPAARIGPGPHDVAVLDLGDLGTIRFELLPEIAPKTVANFERLVADQTYVGTYFHRVIPGFMIQGGDPATRNADPRDDGKGNPGYTIEDEFTHYHHRRGTVSMANTGWPDSAGSQFFIVLADSPHLDGKYTVFGRVVDGMDTVDRVAALEIDTYGRYGPPDRPYPVNATIEAARIERARDALAAGAAAESDAPAAPLGASLAAAGSHATAPAPPLDPSAPSR